MDCQILCMQEFFKAFAACFSKTHKTGDFFQDRKQESSILCCLFFSFMSASSPMSFAEPKINH